MIEIVRATADEKTHRSLVELLGLNMYPEVGQAPIDAEKTIRGIYECLAGGVVFNAMDGDGLVGSIGVVPFEGFWYSREVCLFDRWFYVLPAYRATHEAVGARLERALSAEAEQSNMRAFVAISNPSRKRGSVATITEFRPIGHILSLNGG